MKFYYLIAIILSTSLFSTAESINVSFWNVANNPDNEVEDSIFSTILSDLQRPDVFGLAETDTGSIVRLTDILNSVNSTDTYSNISGSSLGGDKTGLVWDSSSVTLLDSFSITSELTRPTIVGTFRPIGTIGESDFSVVSVHLKSGSSSAVRTTRAAESISLNSSTAHLQNVIFGGDFNIQGSSETVYDTFTQNGFDLAQAPGEYRDNEDFKYLHTQNPAGGIDDRFDIIFASDDLNDGIGLDYVDGSYGVLGNNGTHDLNGSITTGTGASEDVLLALTLASDHLPIYSTFEFNPVPEPSSSLLILLSGCILSIRRKR